MFPFISFYYSVLQARLVTSLVLLVFLYELEYWGSGKEMVSWRKMLVDPFSYISYEETDWKPKNGSRRRSRSPIRNVDEVDGKTGVPINKKDRSGDRKI